MAITEQDILTQLGIDQTRLEEHMSTQPTLYARYAFLAAKADDRVERAKMERKTVEAELDFQIRAVMTAGQERVTDKAVEARVIQDARYKTVVEKLLKSQMEANVLSATVEAFKSRANMLSSLGAMRRTEMEQNMFLGTPATSSTLKQASTNEALKQKFRNGLKQS